MKLPIFLISLTFAGLAMANDKAQLTTLRVVEKPKIQMITGSRQATLQIEAVVRNVGDVEATGVAIKGELPDGSTIDLKGPPTLKRNERQTYEGSGRNILVDPSRVRVNASCQNCR